MSRSDCSFARLSTGVRVAYIEQGEREGPAVVMLHGYTDSHRSFDLIRPRLPESLRVIAMTARGHGRSDKNVADFSLSAMAADAAALLNALNIERAIIVGHSMGAAMALQLAADFPERVAGLALIGAFAGFRDNPGVVELNTEVSAFRDSVDPEFVLAFQESTVAGMIPQRFLDTVIDESLRCPAQVWRAVLQALLDSDVMRIAARTHAPALLIRGAKDAFVPHDDQLKLGNALSSSRLSTLPNVGHAPHWEAPEDTANLIRGFIGELADAA